MSESLKGTCLCESVEFEVEDPQALGYCHCGRCQHWTGSSLAGVVVAKENFQFTKGEDLVGALGNPGRHRAASPVAAIEPDDRRHSRAPLPRLAVVFVSAAIVPTGWP